jgi:hypothetical protein
LSFAGPFRRCSHAADFLQHWRLFSGGLGLQHRRRFSDLCTLTLLLTLLLLHNTSITMTVHLSQGIFQQAEETGCLKLNKQEKLAA